MIRLPDLITVLTALLGFLAMMSDVAEGFSFVLIAVICDGLDGVIARKIERGELGKHLDSLSDAIAFGVAPAFLVYSSMKDALAAFACALYLTCGILRLARFNVRSTVMDASFEGFPITAGGMTVALVAMLTNLNPPWLILSTMIILSLLMVSTISYPKLFMRMKITLPIGGCILASSILFLTGERFFSSALIMILLALMLVYLLSPLFAR